MSSQPAIRVSGLRKSYGDFEAVRGIDFEVADGEVFGLLGPNGAGKTTTVEILEGLRPRTAGDISVLGFDPATDTNAVKDRIGVSLQATNLPFGDTVNNLKASVAGETHEYTDMYPGMAKTARQEGFEEIADWFETLAKAEKSHAGRFQTLLDDIA